MKSKRVLATVLSVVMMVASLPCIVLAENDGPQVDVAEPATAVSLNLTEGVTETVSFGSGETKIVSFTPSASGKYGFMYADGVDLSLTGVTDQYGTPVDSSESERFINGYVHYMTLDAGKTYLFTVSEYDGSYSDSARIMIGRSAKNLRLGTTYVFADTRTKKEITFTPSESGVYVFNVDSPAKIDGWIDMSGNDRVPNKDWTNNSVYIYAYLTGGVTYPLTLSLDNYQNPYYVLNPMKVTVTKNLPTLAMGKNTVTVKENYKDTFFQFKAPEDGVYLIYTSGDHSTSFSMDGFMGESSHYGEGENFSTAVRLEGGKTYFPSIKQSGSSDADIDVYIKKAPEVTQSPSDYAVKAGKAVYYSFTPTKSGYYRFYTNVTTVNVYLTKLGQEGWSRPIEYLNAGEPYEIWVVNDRYGAGNISSALLYIEAIESPELAAGTTTEIDRQHNENYVYALFTPEKSGEYKINIPTENATFILYNSRMEQVCTEQEYSSQGASKECTLTAGQTYLLSVYLGYSDSTRIATVQITEDDTVPELFDGENRIDFDADNKLYYRFKPEKSGPYEICYYLYECNSSPEVYIGEVMQESSNDSYGFFRSTIYYLEKDQEYTVVFPNVYGSPEDVPVYVFYLPELKANTTTQLNRPIPDGYQSFHALIEPTESGIYSLSDGSSNFYTCMVVHYGDSFEMGIPAVYQADARSHYLLEAGEKYLVSMQVTNNVNPVPVKLTLDQKINVGTNTVSIPAPEYEDNPYSYFSFTAPADGHYYFSIENADLIDSFLSVTLANPEHYAVETAGYLNNGKVMFDTDLVKGQTYRLALNGTPNSDGFDLKIDIEAKTFCEEKLEGYSLSLDGTIAVNLYMRLSDEMASSSDTRLNVTFEDGTTRSYSMSDATTAMYSEKKYYVFHIPVAAKEMTASITAQIVNGEFEGTEYTFTVQNYAKYILTHSYLQEYAGAVPLVKALLNYGAYSQKYFGYKTGALANSILTAEEKGLPTIDPRSMPAYDSSLANLPSGVTFSLVSLSLKSETELNLTFTNTTGKALSFTTDNEFVNLKVTNSDGQTKLKITGIPAHKVNEAIRLQVFLEGDTNTYYVSYSPIYYCRNQIERPITESRTSELKDLMAAFYLYNQAARNYIDN